MHFEHKGKGMNKYHFKFKLISHNYDNVVQMMSVLKLSSFCIQDQSAIRKYVEHHISKTPGNLNKPVFRMVTSSQS